MTDLRSLLQRMANELDYLCQLLRDDRREIHALAAEARAALAQPPADGEVAEPSDEKLTQFLFESFRGPIEFICDAEAEAHLMIRNHVKFARAVRARWGAAQPQPVPVSERLPDAGDCTEDGCCWVWDFTDYTWGMFRVDPSADIYWLPAHALPLPSEEEAP